MSGIKGAHSQLQVVDEIEDFEALADEAMAKAAEEYSDLRDQVASGEVSLTEAQQRVMRDMLTKRSPASRAEATLVRCVACGGKGAVWTRWSFLWGDNCWVCAGWGRNLPHEPFRGPFRANPIRVLMQGYTSQEAR